MSPFTIVVLILLPFIASLPILFHMIKMRRGFNLWDNISKELIIPLKETPNHSPYLSLKIDGYNSFLSGMYIRTKPFCENILKYMILIIGLDNLKVDEAFSLRRKFIPIHREIDLTQIEKMIEKRYDINYTNSEFKDKVLSKGIMDLILKIKIDSIFISDKTKTTSDIKEDIESKYLLNIIGEVPKKASNIHQFIELGRRIIKNISY